MSARFTEGERYQEYTDEGGKKRERLVAGLRFTAGKMADSGRFEVESLAARFTGQSGEMSSIRSVGDTQTRWMLSEPMRANMVKTGVDFRRLKERPTTVYVILPAERLRTHSVGCAWSSRRSSAPFTGPAACARACISTKCPPSVTSGRSKCLRTRARLPDPDHRHLPGSGAARRSRERWESFVANAGFVQVFAPNDMTTAKWVSERAGKTTVVAPSASERRSPGGSDPSEGLSWSQVDLAPTNTNGTR